MTFIFVNGCYQSSISSPGPLADLISIDDDTFTLHLPRSFRNNEPIYLAHVNKDKELTSQSMRQRIILEENSAATIVQSYQGRQNIAYTNEIKTEVTLAANAHLHFYKLQQEGDQATHQATFSSQQARDSYLGTYHVVRGGKTSHDDFCYQLLEPGATCESLGFYQAYDKQYFAVNSHIRHSSSHTNSRQWYKGMADDQGHVAFNGMVMVDADIKEVCANQRNNNLLLSPRARVDTKPELEIYAEDVRCSHGATVGQLDEESIFYLRSRGIDRASACALLTAGFANEIFDAFPDNQLARLMRGDL